MGRVQANTQLSLRCARRICQLMPPFNHVAGTCCCDMICCESISTLSVTGSAAANWHADQVRAPCRVQSVPQHMQPLAEVASGCGKAKCSACVSAALRLCKLAKPHSRRHVVQTAGAAAGHSLVQHGTLTQRDSHFGSGTGFHYWLLLLCPLPCRLQRSFTA